MALISRKHGFLFIQAPRTGCTAVAHALMEKLGAERIPPQDIVGPNGKIVVPKVHTRLPQLLDAGLITPEERRKLFVFTTVRNPFDSLVSLYAKKAGRYQQLLKNPDSWIFKMSDAFVEDIRYCGSHSFEEWILKHYAPSRWQRLTGKGRKSSMVPYTSGVDYIMRFETLQQDVDVVLSRIGITTPVEVPRINQTKERSQDYRQMYTPKARRAVEYTFRDDLRKFGYSY